MDIANDTVVEIAAALCQGNRIVDTFRTLVNPGRPIPVEATAVHHLRDRDVIDAPARPDAVRRLTEFVSIAHVLVAHNAAFDSVFLPELLGRPWVCTMRLAKHVSPEAPNFKNQTLRYYLNIDDDMDGDLGTTAHSAMADVRVTAGILFRLLRELRSRVGSRPISWLVDYTKG